MSRRIGIQVVLDMGMGHPAETAPEYRRPPLEERVRDAILMVDSGHESRAEWDYLCRVFQKLQTVKPTKRVKNLLDMIQPVLAKYGKIEATGA